MSAKHTPGPWFVDGLIVTAHQKGSIAFAYGPSMPEASEVGREALANARLCGAAPDLLDALQALTSMLKSAGYGTAYADAAIAKATGGTQ